MAAPSGKGNQPQQQQQEAVNGGDDFPEDQPPPYVEVLPPEERTPSPSPPPTLTRRRRPRHPAPGVAELSLHTLELSRRVLSTLLLWFAARPLGQRALEAVGHTLNTAERAILWARSANGAAVDREPIPLAWYSMMPIVMALMVIRTGAALAERYLDIQLPDNMDLVNWLQRQRIHLEELQNKAALSICTQCVDENDPTHRLLNTWPFNIPYRAAQELGIIPVKVKQPSKTEATTTSSGPVNSSSSSDSSTLTEAEEHTAPSSREFTPPPGTSGDRSMYFSPVGDREAKEIVEKQDDEKQEKVEGEKAQGKKDEPHTIAAEEAERAASALVQPEPSAPSEHLLAAEEAEKAAMSVVPPPPPQQSAPSASSEELLAAEGGSRSEPAKKTEQKSSKGPKVSLFLNLFGTK